MADYYVRWPTQGAGGGGGGTVTSVALTVPSFLSVSGSPITTSGTLAVSLVDESANTIFAGPATGAAAAPTFRVLVAADIPSLGYVTAVTASAPLASSGGQTPNISITSGNLTAAGVDGIAVTGGTGAVIGAGTSIAQQGADSTHNGYLSSTDWVTFNGKQAAGSYITALTGDATASGPGSVALTLATVNGNVGSFGSSTSIPSFTVNAKGLITAASGNVVIAPAGTLTGATLAAGVTASSLTSVGTIVTGVWNGTTIAIANGGTGQTSASTAFNALSPMTTGGDIIYGGASGVGTRLANGSAGQVLTSAGGTSAHVWATPASGLPQVAVFNETQSTGTNGGTFTSGAWQTRTLNTEQFPQSWASLLGNQVTLTSGTYLFSGSAPAYRVDSVQAKIFDITNGQDVVLGNNGYATNGATGTQTNSLVMGVVVVVGTTVFEFRHMCATTRATDGFGQANSFGPEVYSVLSVTKVG